MSERPASSQIRRSRWPVVLVVAVVLLLLVAGVFIGTRPGGLGSLLSGSPLPTASASAIETNAPSSEAATPSATPASPTPLAAPADIIPVGSRAEVLADGLRVREFAGAEAKVVVRLAAGDVVYVLGTGGPTVPPTLADGYAWYPVQFIDGYADWPVAPPAETATFGFVAGHSEAGERFLAVLDPRCPPVLDIDALTQMTDWERAACARDQQLTLEGTFGCGVCDALAQPGTFEPGWLAHYLSVMMPLSPVGHVQEFGVNPIVLAVRPETERIDPELRGSILRVVGHFNDPQASDCVVGVEADFSNDTAAEWYCRERFAVDAWEVIGTDRDYPEPP